MTFSENTFEKKPADHRGSTHHRINDLKIER
jgi:hypothetical protein